MKLRVAVAVLFALTAVAQLRGPASRVPPNQTRLAGPSALASLTGIHPERQTIGAPFRGPVAFPRQSRAWIRIETPHFVIFSSAGERRTRGIVDDLERLTAVLTRTSAQFRMRAQPTRVFLFTDRTDAQPYFDAVRGFRVADATGLTVRQSDRSSMLIDVNARGGDALTPRHELVHDLLGSIDRPLPLWLEEGLAEYYSNAGQPVREHVSLLGTRLQMPMETLFALDSKAPRAGSFYFYAKSWAAVSTLIRRDPSKFFAFLDDLANDGAVTSALQSHFNLSPAQLELAMRSAGMPAPAMTLPRLDTPMHVTTVARADLLVALGDVLAGVPGRENEAKRHFEAAANPSLEAKSVNPSS